MAFIGLLKSFEVRNIRNQHSQYMTRYSKKVGILWHLRWYFLSYIPKYLMGEVESYCFYRNGKVSAYLIIDKGWISIAVGKKYQGMGMGSILLQECLSKNKTYFLEVFKTNKKAISLYKKCGFKKIKQIGKVEIYGR